MSKTMNGVLSLLDEEHTTLVQDIWDYLDETCGLSVQSFPHFSWQIAEEYDFDGLGKKLAELTSHLPPFTIRTAGIGIFTGESPVVFIPIVKDRSLLELHKKIWEETFPFGKGVSNHYAPENWIPHITLASKDVDPDTLINMVNFLVPRDINWEITIDHYAIGCQSPEGVSEITTKYQLTGK